MKKIIHTIMVFVFVVTSFTAPAGAQSMVGLPEPGVMVELSAVRAPVMLQGLRVNPDDPLSFEFLVDPGQDRMGDEAYRQEIKKNAGYFFASVAIPEKAIWVNLSPYENDRMMAPEVQPTVLGEGLAREDYRLKAMVSSLLHPDREPGQQFWAEVYSRIKTQFGDVAVPVETFNKVWIVADTAKVYEKDNAAYLQSTHLKVMTDSDYTALRAGAAGSHERATGASSAAAEVLREAVLPVLEKEINNGAYFAELRQIFNGFVLASWYKRKLKESAFARAYADREATGGLEASETAAAQKVYDRYLQAFKTGVFDLIREEEGADGAVVPRRYFSGGAAFGTGHIEYESLPAGNTTIGLAGSAGRGLNVARLAVRPRDKAQKVTPKQNVLSMVDQTDIEALGIKAAELRRAREITEDLSLKAGRELLVDMLQVLQRQTGLETHVLRAKILTTKVYFIPAGIELPRGFALKRARDESDSDAIYVTEDFYADFIVGGPQSGHHFFLRTLARLASTEALDLLGLVYARIDEFKATSDYVKATVTDFHKGVLAHDNWDQNRYDEKAVEITELSRDMIEVIPAEASDVSSAVKITAQLKEALYNISENVFNGLEAPVTAGQEMELDELIDQQVESLALVATKLSPPTLIHRLLQMVLTGSYAVKVSAMMVTAQDARKKSVKFTFAPRRKFAQAAMEILQRYAKLLNVRDEGLQRLNGEPFATAIVGKMKGFLKRLFYQAGSDHNFGFAPHKTTPDIINFLELELEDSMRDSLTNITVNPAGYQDLVAAYALLAGHELPEGYTPLAGGVAELVLSRLDELRGQPGIRKFYWTAAEIEAHAQKLKETYRYNKEANEKVLADHLVRKEMIDLILSAASGKLVDILWRRWQAEDHKLFLPEIDTVGQLYLTQNAYPETQVIFAHTVRVDAIRPDVIRDLLVETKKVLVTSVHLVDAQVSSSRTRSGGAWAAYKNGRGKREIRMGLLSSSDGATVKQMFQDWEAYQDLMIGADGSTWPQALDLMWDKPAALERKAAALVQFNSDTQSRYFIREIITEPELSKNGEKIKSGETHLYIYAGSRIVANYTYQVFFSFGAGQVKDRKLRINGSYTSRSNPEGLQEALIRYVERANGTDDASQSVEEMINGGINLGDDMFSLQVQADPVGLAETQTWSTTTSVDKLLEKVNTSGIEIDVLGIEQAAAGNFWMSTGAAVAVPGKL